MTTLEAYNAGLSDAAALARATADRLATRLPQQPTRLNFAIEALDGVADAAESLRLPVIETAPPAIVAREPVPPIICSEPAPDGIAARLP